MVESDIQRDIIIGLRAFGFKVYRMNAGYIRKNVKLAEDGTPDLLVALDKGRSMWIEVKQPGKLPTDKQLQRHAELRALGHKVIVAYCVEDVIEGMG